MDSFGNKKVVVASDSFKGSLSSKEIINIFQEVSINTNLDICGKEIADGGEGTINALLSAGGFAIKTINCKNPLMKDIQASYIVSKDSAVIEMAQASGLTLIDYKDGNAAITTTYGTGQLILDAYTNGARKIFVSVGGSATNDGGIGALAALGYKFLDKKGLEVKPIGKNLIKIAGIDSSNAVDMKDATFIIIADVDNPLIGEKGATFFYGPQKGAVGQVKINLERGMHHYANVVETITGISLHNMKGAGAACGLAGGLVAFLNATIQSGIETILDLINFDDAIKGASAIVTGEGCIDEQSLHGKVIYGITKRAMKSNIPVYVIAGISKIDIEIANRFGIRSIKTLSSKASGVENSINNAKKYAKETAKEIIEEILND